MRVFPRVSIRPDYILKVHILFSQHWPTKLWCAVVFSLLLDVGWWVVGRWLGWLARRTGQRGFVKRLIAIWKATFKARLGHTRVAADAAVAVFRIYCFWVYCSCPPQHPYNSHKTPKSTVSSLHLLWSECLSMATAIEEFHFETFNFQRATLSGGLGIGLRARGLLLIAGNGYGVDAFTHPVFCSLV